MKFNSISVFASVLLAFAVADAALPGNWPPVDKPPPPQAEWIKLVDPAKVPNAPLVKTVGQCPDKDTFCNWSCTGCTRPDSDFTKCPTKGDWGITFDDGPTEFTSGLLDFLKTKDVKVTFFVVGSRVIENPEILKRAVDDGHQIGIHTWSHPALTTQSNEQIIAELKWTELAIQKAVGVTPKFMRPPFGDYDDRVRGIATQLGYKIVIWDLDTNDWMSADDPSFDLTWIEGNFTQWVKMPSDTGHISLEHDLYKQTAARAQLAIPIVLNAGFLIKPVASCLGEKPYIEDVPVGGDPSTASSAPAAPAPSDPSTPAADPAPAPADPTNPYPTQSPNSGYLDGGSGSSSMPSSTAASGGAPSNAPSSSYPANSASLNSINLSSLVLLIVGSLMFI